jgi:hypothetical protein
VTVSGATGPASGSALLTVYVGGNRALRAFTSTATLVPTTRSDA